MNVVELTGEEGNTSQGAVWKVMGPISFAISIGLLGIGGFSECSPHGVPEKAQVGLC